MANRTEEPYSVQVPINTSIFYNPLKFVPFRYPLSTEVVLNNRIESFFTQFFFTKSKIKLFVCVYKYYDHSSTSYPTFVLYFYPMSPPFIENNETEIK